MPILVILHCSPNIFKHVPKLSTKKDFSTKYCHEKKRQSEIKPKSTLLTLKTPRNLSKGNKQINMPTCTHKVFLSSLIYGKKNWKDSKAQQ